MPGIFVMMGRSIATVLTIGVLMFARATTWAQEDIELEDLLADIPIWEQFYTLRAGGGYNDNLLLSDFNDEKSAMILSGFDITIFRLPIDDNHFNFFANLDSEYYPDGEAVNHEMTALALVQGAHDFSDEWQGGLTGQYFYQDQVVDASVTEVDISTVPVTGNQFEVSTDWRYQFRKNQWIDADVSGLRQLFADDVLDSYWQYGSGVAYGLNYGRRSELLLGYEIQRRLYDSREQYTATGEPIPGTDLRYLYQNFELGLKHYFDEQRQWRLYTRLGYGFNQDNGFGYFDFDRYNVSLQLRYQNELWEVRAQGVFTYYDYALQESNEDPGELRVRGAFGGGIRCERLIAGAFRLFAEYEYEQTKSNLSYDNYTVNVVSAGVEWEF